MKVSSVVSLIVISCVFITIGYLRRNVILESNLCEMTYSRRDTEPIEVSSSIIGPTLHKYLSSKSLKRHPVLFIPGHLGSMEQARSLAAQMHNNANDLQYFSIDFKDYNIAFHGSNVVRQAMFVNDAISAIADLYDTPTEIIIVAHSLAGIVARTAVLLSNHPRQCLVSDIIMLSSPNVKSPWGPDSSMDTLFESTNKAWQQSYYHTSSQCKETHHAQSLNYSASLKLTADWKCPVCVPKIRLASISGGILDMHVHPQDTMLFGLAPKPQNKTASVVANHEAHARKQSNSVLSFVLTPVMRLSGAVMWPVKKAFEALGLVMTSSPLPAATAPTVNISTSSVNSSVGSVDEPGTVAVAVADVCDNSTVTLTEAAEISGEDNDSGDIATATVTPTASAVNDSNTVSAKPPSVLGAITASHWQQHFVQYIDGQMLSVRSSQLAGVEIPIDHNAIVWCKQFVGVLVKGLSKLSLLPAVGTGGESVAVNWQEIFPVAKDVLVAVHRDDDESNQQLIEPLQKFLQDNASVVSWKMGEKKDRQFISQSGQSKLRKSLDSEGVRQLALSAWHALAGAAVEFVSHKLWYIAVCYVVISIAVLSVPLFLSLSGHKTVAGIVSFGSDSQINSFWSTLSPWVHWHGYLISPSINYWLRVLLPTRLYKISSRWFLPAVLLMIGVKLALDLSYLTGTVFQERYGDILSWVAAYGAAIVLRICLRQILLVKIAVLGFITRSAMIGIKFVFWKSKYTRKPLKRTYNWFKKLAEKLFPSFMRTYFAIVPCCLMAIMCATVLMTADRHCFMSGVLQRNPHCLAASNVNHNFGLFTIIMSGLCVTSFLALAMVALWVMINYSSNAKAAHSVGACRVMNLMLVIFPSVALALPTAVYSWQLLFANPSYFGSALAVLGMFDPERIHYCMALIAMIVCLHTAASKFFSGQEQEAVEGQEEAVAWLVEAFGPGYITEQQQYRPLDSHLYSGKAGSVECVHEDGGKYAVFEAVNDKAVQSTVGRGVVLGCTYRVLSCNCPSDTKLKDISDWCEWCRCKKCGGKNLPKAARAKHANYFNGRSEASKTLSDFTIDLGLFIGIVGMSIAALTFGGNRLYKHMYLVGILCAVFVARDVARLMPAMPPAPQ